MRYARKRDEGAFAELVRRQVDLVYSAARRLVVDPHLAEDVTQAVFTALARQATEVARRLEGGTPLSGWLHVTTRNHAAATVRTEERRRAREQEAIAMQESPVPESTANWEQIAPQLDHALAELSDTDRDALLLRFFERQTAKEIGCRLGVGEEAAQKRVARALERLRGVFVARGLAVPSATLAGVLTANAVQTAPLPLAGTIAAGTATVTTGALSTLGILQLMASTKLKLGMAALVAAGMATTVIFQQRENQRLRAELATAQASQATPQHAPASNTAPADTRQLDELLRLRGEVAQLRQATRDARNGPAAAPNAGVAATVESEDLVKAMQAADAVAVQTVNAQKHLGLALQVYAIEHQGQLPTSIEELKPILGDVLDPDGMVSGVPLDLFEFHVHGRAVGLSEPEKILLREKQARRLPDGTWERIYSLADGSVHRVKRPDGDFSEFEKARTGTQDNAPKRP